MTDRKRVTGPKRKDILYPDEHAVKMLLVIMGYPLVRPPFDPKRGVCHKGFDLFSREEKDGDI
jgi:hypothetical protein